MAIKLKVPEEMAGLMDDWQVYIQCRDQAINSVFKAKRAIYYGKQALKAERLFWKKAYELYPETGKGKWSYSFNERTLDNSDAL